MKFKFSIARMAFMKFEENIHGISRGIVREYFRKYGVTS